MATPMLKATIWGPKRYPDSDKPIDIPNYLKIHGHFNSRVGPDIQGLQNRAKGPKYFSKKGYFGNKTGPQQPDVKDFYITPGTFLGSARTPHIQRRKFFFPYSYEG